jgi:ERCC4-related helicase
VEFRSEEDEDIKAYSHPRQVDECTVSFTAELRPIQGLVKQLLREKVGSLRDKQVGSCSGLVTAWQCFHSD